MDDDACAADLLCEAVASHRKSVALSAPPRRRPASPDEAWPAAEEPPSPPPPPLPESDDEEEPAAPVSVAVEALSAVAAESRGRLATALLALLNSASETELRDVLAGIGAVRARLIVETRSERLFESLDDAFGRIGLSAKQASNLTLANLRQILASRPTTSPRKRDGARARRSYRKSGRVLARKEGDDPKREYPATIVKVHDCGTVYDIKYDDGTTWKNAPAEVAARCAGRRHVPWRVRSMSHTWAPEAIWNHGGRPRAPARASCAWAARLLSLGPRLGPRDRCCARAWAWAIRAWARA